MIAFYSKTDLIKPEDKAKAGTLMIAMTSDRGLCGGVHSAVAKRIRAVMKTDPNAANIKIVCIGDKAKSMLARYSTPFPSMGQSVSYSDLNLLDNTRRIY